jgi:hypothetical protein
MIPIPADGPLTGYCEIRGPYHVAWNLTVKFVKQLNAVFAEVMPFAGGHENECGKAAGRGWHEAEREGR